MNERPTRDDVLQDLISGMGRDVIHLPYTQEFEAVCQTILGHAPTTAEKHAIWEAVVRLRTSPSSTVSVPIPPPKTVTQTPEQAKAVPLRASPVTNPASLFGEGSLAPRQPWTVPKENPADTARERERERILAELADSRLGSTEQKVAFLLHRFPETRESDIALCLRYWRRFQSEILTKWNPLELEVLYELDRLETIGRMRRLIQELGLFRRTDETIAHAKLFQQELHEFLVSHSTGTPEVRFYLDETGNEGNTTYTGVGGLCAGNWQQYEKHHAALANWRREQKWPDTIHFVETNDLSVDRPMALLGQLARRTSGLLFLGYALQSRGRTHDDLCALFVQLVVDSLHHLNQCGCLSEPRMVRVIKEWDSGFDSIYVPKMQKQLSELIGADFPGRLAIHPIECVPKGREVFLECADLVAGGMRRRALYKGPNPKDRLAEAVMNVTGFEDRNDEGALFKYYS